MTYQQDFCITNIKNNVVQGEYGKKNRIIARLIVPLSYTRRY